MLVLRTEHNLGTSTQHLLVILLQFAWPVSIFLYILIYLSASSQLILH